MINVEVNENFKKVKELKIDQNKVTQGLIEFLPEYLRTKDLFDLSLEDYLLYQNDTLNNQLSLRKDGNGIIVKKL